jgi:hypothetical protein
MDKPDIHEEGFHLELYFRITLEKIIFFLGVEKIIYACKL